VTGTTRTTTSDSADVPRRLEHLTPEQRTANGKQARAEVPRERHAEFEPAPNRADPIDLLEEQSRTRVPELVPIRYGRMSASAFAFFRGAGIVMASDLSATPVSGLRTQICGDAHLSNFGFFATPERRLVFDVTDFDETSEGPWEWDLKRLAASVEIAGRDLGFADAERRDAVLAAASSYRTTMRSFAAMTNLSVWYASLAMEEVLPELRGQIDAESEKLLDDALERMRAHETVRQSTKLIVEVDGQPRFRSDPPFVVRLDELLDGDRATRARTALADVAVSYRRSLNSDRRRLLDQYRVADIARKVVGVGSVGTRDWIILLLGRDDSDRLVLQAKEAEGSVVQRFAGAHAWDNQGRRVVEGQRLMQAASDIFLGWDHVYGMDGRPQRDFYLRQFRDWKTTIRVEGLRPKGLAVYAKNAGWTLARGHARSGDQIAIAAYLGKSSAFDEALAGFAARYADRNQRDYEALLAAIRDGRIRAETGR
jgi:uncharacterized protein (DUF2252 family)